MPRIPDSEMTKRVQVLQDILEDNPEGLSVKDMVEALKAKGVVLPKSEYQAVNSILKRAEKDEVIIKSNGKWIPVSEDEEVVDDSPVEMVDQD